MNLQKTFFDSANAWFGLIAALGALVGFGAVENEAAKEGLAAGIALAGSGNILFHWFRDNSKQLIEKVKTSLRRPEFYLSLIVAAAGFVRWLPVAELRALVEAIFSGDTSLMIQAAFALLLVVIKLIKPGGLKA